MLRVDNKKEQIEIVGDSELLKNEIGTLMLALCGEVAKVSKSAAEDMFNHIVKSIACVAAFLETKRGVKLKDFHNNEKEEQEKPSISKDMDDAIEGFFEALNQIIEKPIFIKKKGDK